MNAPHCFFVKYPTEKECSSFDSCCRRQHRNRTSESPSLHLESDIVNAYESLWFFSRELCLQTVYGAGAPEDELYEKFSLRWRGVPGEVWWYGTGVSVGLWAQRRPVCVSSSYPPCIAGMHRMSLLLSGVSAKPPLTHTTQSCIRKNPRQPTQDTVALKHGTFQ